MSFQNSFIERIKKGAIKGWESYQILPSITIAQAILESDWGRSQLAIEGNNLFGIKGDYKGDSIIIRTGEHVSNGVITIDAHFRKYPTIEDSLIDHANFFTSTEWRAKKYQKVIGETDYQVAAKELSKAGYATDPEYANKLINIIETYKLDEYDIEGVNKMAKIYIDPGHGGHDGGASGSGLREKDWVLEVSLELARILKQAGHSVKLSRSTDKFIGLSARTNDANRWGADIFISIHFNAGGGFGWEDFIFNGNVSSNTRKLQNSVHNAIKPILNKHGLRNRGKKRANFAVLRQSRMPAILLEAGFVDSSDVNVLKKSSYKKDVAVAVANGVQNYFGLGAVSKPSKPSGSKSIKQMAREVIAGKHGNGHANRQKSLGVNDATYSKVRKEVNRQAGVTNKPKPKRKSNKTIAQEVIDGKWGNNPERARKLKQAGYNASAIQSEVNRLVSGRSSSFNAQSIANQIKKGIDNRGRRIPNGHANRRRHFNLTKSQYQQVRRLVNK